MKLDKKQIPMLIVLAVLVVGCVGYLSFSMSAPNSAKQASQAAGKSADEVAKPATDEADAAVKLEADSAGVFPNLAMVPARRDPFTPQKLPGSEPIVTFRPQTRITPTATQPIRPVGVPVPQIGGGSGNPWASVQPVHASPIIAVPPAGKEPEREQQQDFLLTGVVSGQDSSVVILRVGKDERHVVREGQTIGGRYTVKSVTSDGLVLSSISDKQQIPVKIGGNKNAN